MTTTPPNYTPPPFPADGNEQDSAKWEDAIARLGWFTFHGAHYPDTKNASRICVPLTTIRAILPSKARTAVILADPDCPSDTSQRFRVAGETDEQFLARFFRALDLSRSTTKCAN